MKIEPENPLNIILADDDEDDRMFFKDALKEINANVNLTTVKDGEELMRVLMNPLSVLPEIIFLDLNMPRKNGFECLTEIRRNQQLKNIFIVVYSTAGGENVVEEAFNKGAHLFINKLNSYTELKTTLAKVFTVDYPVHPKRPSLF